MKSKNGQQQKQNRVCTMWAMLKELQMEWNIQKHSDKMELQLRKREKNSKQNEIIRNGWPSAKPCKNTRYTRIACIYKGEIVETSSEQDKGRQRVEGRIESS